MRRFLILFLSLLVLSISVDVSAAKPKRNAQSVKKERRATAGEVEQTRKQINQNTAETRRQLNRLASLTADAERSSKLIENLNKEIADIDNRIKGLDDSIATMERNLESLRRSFSQNLRDIRSARQQMNPMALVFSSKSFTDAYRRYRYVNQLKLWQKDKTGQIARLQSDVASRRDKVKEVRNSRAAKLSALTAENEKLKSNRDKTEVVVKDLQRQGSSLKKVLEEKQKQLKALDNELDRIIAEEARRAEEARKAEEARLAAEAKKKAEEARRAAAENKTAGKDSVTSPVKNERKPESVADKKTASKSEYERKSSAVVAMTGSFESNKGKMPFPVDGCYSIVSRFGLNTHPDVATVKVNNSGIDVETAPGTSARAVFDGEVSSVFHVNGYQNVVMLRHGNYLTVYAGIDRLAVKKGDKLKAGQSIGTIYSDPDDENRTVLHFEVRKERAKLNPEEWVK